MRRTTLLAALACVVAAACGRFGSNSDDGVEPAEAGVDDAVAVSDAGLADGTAIDAADAEGPNLLMNGDFEIGCAVWGANSGTLSESTTAHDGAKSCEVCAQSGVGYGFTQTVTRPFVADTRLVVDGWVRRPPTEDAGTPQITVAMLEVKGRAHLGQVTVGAVGLAADWVHVAGIYVVPDGGVDGVEVQVNGANPAKCFLLDDMALHVLP